MKLRLIRFQATDGVVLPGLLYEPARRSRDAAIFLHGNGDASVFYAGRTNILGEELTRRGIAWFAFNNRGALQVKRLQRTKGDESERVLGGTAYELIRDCVHDIDGAISMLRKEGYERFHLVGHSTGANKICVYNALKPRNRATRYVLLGPGDDTGLYYAAAGPERFRRALERCREEVDRGRGEKLVPRWVSPYLMSWASMYDTINPDGDYNVFPFLEVTRGPRLSRKTPFLEYRTIRKPTLVVFGENDEFCYGDVEGCMEAMRKYAPVPRKFTFRILSDTDHGFHGSEPELARSIARFIRSR